MKQESTNHDQAPVAERLIDSAMVCFLNDEYHKVTTRQIAEQADTNISMIRYYFGNKEGLYEEMIKQTLQPLIDVLDNEMLESDGGFNEYFKLYYDTMLKNPKFPALILKVLAMNQGPGKRFVQQLLERGRVQSRKRLEKLQQAGLVDKLIDPVIVRISFVSLAMMPILLKSIFEEELGQEMNISYFNNLAEFNGSLISSGLLPKTDNKLEEKHEKSN